LDEFILFFSSLPQKKNERNLDYIAAYCQATLAEKQAKACQRVAILSTHTYYISAATNI
jgi:hypothetical protein